MRVTEILPGDAEHRSSKDKNQIKNSRQRIQTVMKIGAAQVIQQDESLYNDGYNKNSYRKAKTQL